jgi:hypothetical protein
MYLDMGSERSLAKVEERLGKSHQLISRWSAQYDWIERVREFERHLLTAETESLVTASSENREANLRLMGKLRGLLDTVLDDHIRRREPPSVRWTQACMAMTKIMETSLTAAKDVQVSEQVAKVEELYAELERKIQGERA